MLSLDNKEFLASLEKYKEELTKGLEQAVREFSLNIVQEVIPKTPYGNASYFMDWYSYRQMTNPLYPAMQGMTRANWDISIGTYSPVIDYIDGSRKGENSIQDSIQHLRNYKLGDTVYIYNATPYIGMIKSNQAPEGVPNKIAASIRAITTSAAKFKDSLR